MAGLIRQYGKQWHLNHIGSLGCLYFSDRDVGNYEEAKKADTKAFAEYFRFMLTGGIHLGPSQFEAMFVSNAHTRETTAKTLEIFEDYLRKG